MSNIERNWLQLAPCAVTSKHDPGRSDVTANGRVGAPGVSKPSTKTVKLNHPPPSTSSEHRRPGERVSGEGGGCGTRVGGRSAHTSQHSPSPAHSGMWAAGTLPSKPGGWALYVAASLFQFGAGGVADT